MSDQPQAECLCKHCSAVFTFDPSRAGETIGCPNCQLDTTLYLAAKTQPPPLPTKPPTPAPLQPQPIPPDQYRVPKGLVPDFTGWQVTFSVIGALFLWFGWKGTSEAKSNIHEIYGGIMFLCSLLCGAVTAVLTAVTSLIKALVPIWKENHASSLLLKWIAEHEVSIKTRR